MREDTQALKGALPQTASSATISEPASIFMDHLRWISALLVVIGHIRQLYFVDYQEVVNPSAGWAAFYGISRLAHQAVLIFFLISGAVIAGRFMERKGWVSFDLPRYAVARLTRLWLVLIPVLAICIVQLLLTPAPWLPKECELSAKLVLGNLFFLQDLLVETPCNNIPLWSLANEFWYYALTGLTVYATARANSVGRALAVVALVASIAMIASSDTFTERNVLAYFPIWLLGALVFCRHIPRLPLWAGMGALLAGTLIVRIPSLPLDFYARDVLFAVVAFLALLSMRDLPETAPFSRLLQRTSGLARALAGQSYSLYLVHYPVALAFMPLALDATGNARHQPSLAGLGLMLAISACAYGVAHISYLLLESRTHVVRARIERWLGLRT